MLVLAAVTVVRARLEPAAPRVPRASVRIDTVQEGELLRGARPRHAPAAQYPLIAAQTDGRVERVIVRPGAVVEPDTVLVEMSNPDPQEQTAKARYDLEAAETQLAEMELKLRSGQLNQRAALTTARAEYESALLRFGQSDRQHEPR